MRGRFLRIGILVVCLFEVFGYRVPVAEASFRRSSVISGSLTPGSMAAGAVVTLGGSASATTTADASGNYTFSHLGTGSYTVTPSKAGLSFQPSSQTISLSRASTVTVNFTATPILQSISISAPNTSIATGSSDQFAAIGTLGDGSTQNLTNSVTWTSANPAAATISLTGLATGVGSGSTNIVASHNGITSNSVALSVTTNISPTLQSIAVSAANSTLRTGLSEQLTATGTFSDGSTQNVTNSVTWSSSNPAAVRVGTGAVALAAGVGQATISATQGSVSGTVTISASASISGTVSPAAAGTALTLSGGASATTSTDANGNYSFTVLANGAYSVTPTKTLYSFAPVNAAVTVNNANVTGVNFTTAAGQLSISSSAFSFGNVNVGSSAQLKGSLAANGGDVTLTSDTIAGSGFGISGITFPITISSGKTAAFSVTFAPTSTGSASATLSLSNNSTTLATASLSGTGAGLTVSPTNLNFGQTLDGSTSSSQSLTLSAVGNSVTITSANIAQNGGGGSAFSIAGMPTLPFVLAAGQSLQVSAAFAPAPGSPGAAAGTVTFASSVNSVAPTLSGSGVANVMLSWAPDATANVTYSIYRCSISVTACIQAQPANFVEIASGLGSTAYTDSSVSSGNSYYYALTATDTNNVQSSLSSVSSAVVIP